MRKLRLILFPLMALILAAAAAYGAWHLLGGDSAPARMEIDGAQPVHYDTPLTLRTDKGEVKLRVQLAITDAEQETGMMWRTSVGAEEGMLFVSPDVAPRTFWMKNTLIPLDLIFIGEGGGIVSISRNAIPKDLTPIPSVMPAKAVLEVAGGSAERWGLKVGDKVETPALR